MTKCLNPSCTNEAYARGLCKSCYGIAYRIVQDGIKTWEDLEEQGKCLPAYLGVHPARAWLNGDDK